MTDKWWCEHAWLGGDSVADGVTFSVSDGRIAAIDKDTTAQPGANRLRGLVIPGLAIFLTVMAFNLFGDGLRDALDPRSSR